MIFLSARVDRLEVLVNPSHAKAAWIMGSGTPRPARQARMSGSVL